MPRRFHAHTPVAVAAALMLVPYLQTTTIAAEGTTAAASDVVMLSADATRIEGRWVRESDATAAGGSRLRHPNAGAAKVPGALASPADFFELTRDRLKASRPIRSSGGRTCAAKRSRT